MRQCRKVLEDGEGALVTGWCICTTCVLRKSAREDYG